MAAMVIKSYPGSANPLMVHFFGTNIDSYIHTYIYIYNDNDIYNDNVRWNPEDLTYFMEV